MWEKLANVDRRWIYALMIFVIALALIKPIGLAIVPSADTQKVYDIIENLPRGSIVWMGMEFSAGGIPELMPALQSMIRQGFKEGRDLRFVCAGMWQMAGDMADQAFSIVKEEFPHKQYGVDWVNIGYKPGGDVLLQQYQNSIIETAKGVDFYGDDLSQFPLMKEFTSLKQAELVAIFCTGTPGEKEYIKHVTSPNKIPLVEAAISVSIPECMPLVQAGQISGLLAGMKGAAEYEVLVEKPGSATAGMDAQSFSHALIIIFMILGNLGYVFTKNKKES
ncbi:MAG: hypothetical protein ACOX5Q_04885 [Bacillota bacterium]|nr:hypothetical protein [Candidatus Fermentithermobacillaceae bacterium]